MNTAHDSLIPPARLPEPGFYYHYKHDPNGALNNYAYLVLGAGHHTEADARPEDKFQQVYLPLYDTAPVYGAGKLFYLRPLDMALDQVEVGDITVNRFQKIEDEEIITQLKEIGKQMYGAWFW